MAVGTARNEKVLLVCGRGRMGEDETGRLQRRVAGGWSASQLFDGWSKATAGAAMSCTVLEYERMRGEERSDEQKFVNYCYMQYKVYPVSLMI